ncbi:helix-turn-helix domain-containing protein [Streptomyces sp. NPDC005811]|uniref:helix-turn-helix domain-containing protein n=1 Tax=Streptomyces sp. NPDC005811 TaxID=3154565 RepID=UPI0033E2C1D2
MNEIVKLRWNWIGRDGGLPMFWYDQSKVGNYDTAIRILDRPPTHRPLARTTRRRFHGARLRAANVACGIGVSCLIAWRESQAPDSLAANHPARRSHGNALGTDVPAGEGTQLSRPVVSHVSTHSVDPVDRIGFWEEYNRQALVGLSCSSHSPQGLLATQTNVELGGLGLADIAGNEHVIERTPQTCRALPKDSVFVSLLTEGAGHAVFFHEGGCLTPRTGDLILYDTRRSYLFGFPSPMRQLLVDIPREVFETRCATGEVSTPMLFGRVSAAEGALVSALGAVLSDWATGHGSDDAGGTEDTVLDLVRTLAAPRLGSASAPRAAISQLAVARDYMERHLADPGLSAGRVAEAVGVSARHLSRIFQPTGVSPSRYILEQRLAKAHEELAGPGTRHLTIAEVAHHWGFASQAHFTRVFRDRFGRTPGETRPSRA